MKKLVKRILATAVTASMAISALPVFAADGDDDYINFENTQGAWGGSGTAIATDVTPVFMEDGFGSKPAGDKFSKLVVKYDFAGGGVRLFNNSDFTWSEANKSRVLTVEMDFVPIAGIQAVRLDQKYRRLVHAVDLSKAKKDDWNHIKFEIDLAAKRAGVELNGEKIRNFNLAEPFDWSTMGQMRFVFESDGKGDENGDMILYSDNIKIRTSDKADDVYLNDGFTYDTATAQHYWLINFTSTYEAGAAGKAEDDRALSISGDSAKDVYLAVDVPVREKYIKISYNLMPKSNFLRVQNKARNTVLHYDMAGGEDNANEGHRAMKLNQWNKVELILENKTGYDSTTMNMVFGTKLYINGVLISDVDRGNSGAEKNAASDDTFPFRLGIIPTGTASPVEVMLDDFKIQTSSEAAFEKDLRASLSASTAAVTEPAQLTNGKIAAYDTAKVSDFSADGAAVRAFADSSFNEQLPENSSLSIGNVIVTEDLNHAVKYYEVTSVDEDPSFTPIDVSENFDNQSSGAISPIAAVHGTTSYESGIAGKGASDYSMRADKTTKSQTDIYLEYQAVPSSAEYITVEYNILPDENYDKGRIGARYSNVIGAEISSSVLNTGRWNSIKYVLKNLETSKTAAGDNCKAKADIYVNGKRVMENGDALITLSAEGKYQIRFIASAKSAESPMTVYYDDVKIKTYKSMPSLDVEVPELLIDDNYGIIDNDKNTVLVYAGATVDDIDAGALDMTVYKDDSFGEIVPDGTLSAGNIIVVSKSGSDMLFYYTVIPGAKTIDSISFAYSSDGTNFEDASKSNVKNGTYSYTVTASNTEEDDMPVTAIIALYDANDRLVNVQSKTANVLSGTIGEEVNVLLSVAGAAAGMKIKTFIWDTTENAKPYETEPVRILIIGNSITQHNASESKGWLGTWGMAASSEANDYVHKLISKINTKTTNYEIKYRNISEFEKYFYNFDKFATVEYKDLADFDADIIIATFGANCNNSDNEMDPEFSTPYEFEAKHYENIINFFNADGKAKIIAGKTVLTTEKNLAAIDAAAALHPEWKKVDMSGYNGSDYDATSYYKDYPSVFADNVIDGVLKHPGDKAMAAMADDLWEVLPTLIDSVR